MKFLFGFMHTEQLIVFLKAPRIDTVKTRLAQSIGTDAACAAYVTLVETLLGGLAALDPVVLRFAPDDAMDEVRPWLKPGWQAQPQGRGDLGQRLARAFSETFEHGASRVVIIGSDCPAVTAEDVRTAWRALESNDVVLGPATDGGYWLIGLRESRPRLFENISWSTGTVLQETLVRAEAGGLRVQLLRTLTDVDTGAGWREFLASRGGPAR